MQNETRDPTSFDLDRVGDLGTLTARATRRWGDTVGLILDEYGERLTFVEIDQRSNTMADALRQLGVESGDRVAVMLRNRAEFPLTWLGLAKLGATMVPVNVNYKSHDTRYVLEHSEATAIVTSSEFVPLLRDVRWSVETLKHVVSVDGPDGGDVLGVEELQPTNHGALAEGRVVGAAESLANVQYTSGTTGRPKGCMLSQGYWVTIARRFIEEPPALGQGDVLLTAQPFHYMDPQWNVAASLACGAPLVVLDRFHPSTFWEKVREYGVTFFYCLGVIPTLLLKMPPDPADRENRVRHVSCSAIPVRLHRKLEERFGAPWHELFGMTETGVDLAVHPEERDELVGTGCIGRPLSGCEARVVGEDDRPLPRGREGELVLRGTGMMDGYYKNQEATEAAFRSGWFHTGDLARVDEDGRVFYVGRTKDMIRRGGENVAAAEVEEVIKLHPAVRLAACVPVPDEIRGEEVKAYVVLDDAGKESATPQGLAAFCSERLAYFKVSRYWEYREDLPRTPSEKIAKHILRGEKPDLAIDSYDSVDATWR